ncbi:MAG: Stp1/IreP family PP2C-type Ser/Thr phosphatase [Candidatus Thiodiazotropha sp.]
MDLEVAIRTDKGRVREQNEDAVGGDPEAGLIVLADGMGGANAGEVASELAVELLTGQLVAGQQSGADIGQSEILEAMQLVNQAILDLSQQVASYQGMGTTLVMGLFKQQRVIYAHVGDSRLYRLRKGLFEQLTTDHSLIQEMVNQGDFGSIEEALMAGVPTNVLSRAFGSDAEVEVDLAESEVEPGDIYLFCSDGLTGMLMDEEMQSILENNKMDLPQQADELVDFACRMGGVDNISVILARAQANDVQN